MYIFTHKYLGIIRFSVPFHQFRIPHSNPPPLSPACVDPHHPLFSCSSHSPYPKDPTASSNYHNIQMTKSSSPRNSIFSTSFDLCCSSKKTICNFLDFQFLSNHPLCHSFMFVCVSLFVLACACFWLFGVCLWLSVFACVCSCLLLVAGVCLCVFVFDGLCLCVCICVWLCVFGCVCVFVCECICCVCVFLFECVCLCVLLFVCGCLWLFVCVCVCVCLLLLLLLLLLLWFLLLLLLLLLLVVVYCQMAVTSSCPHALTVCLSA